MIASRTKPETQVPLDTVLITLVALGVLLVCTSHLPRGLANQLKVLYAAGALYAVALLAWLLGRWNPQAGKWCAVLGITAIAQQSSTLTAR